jgi:hypothetical protein
VGGSNDLRTVGLAVSDGTGVNVCCAGPTKSCAMRCTTDNLFGPEAMGGTEKLPLEGLGVSGRSDDEECDEECEDGVRSRVSVTMGLSNETVFISVGVSCAVADVDGGAGVVTAEFGGAVLCCGLNDTVDEDGPVLSGAGFDTIELGGSVL